MVESHCRISPKLATACLSPMCFLDSLAVLGPICFYGLRKSLKVPKQLGTAACGSDNMILSLPPAGRTFATRTSLLFCASLSAQWLQPQTCLYAFWLSLLCTGAVRSHRLLVLTLKMQLSHRVLKLIFGNCFHTMILALWGGKLLEVAVCFPLSRKGLATSNLNKVYQRTCLLGLTYTVSNGHFNCCPTTGLCSFATACAGISTALYATPSIDQLRW